MMDNQLHVRRRSKKRNKDESCEAAHPTMKSSHDFFCEYGPQRQFSESSTISLPSIGPFTNFEVEDSKLFVKPKSPTNSDLDQYSDQSQHSVSDSEDLFLPDHEAEEQQLPQQVVETFDKHCDNPISGSLPPMVCEEVSQPCTSQKQLVTGHDKSASLKKNVTLCRERWSKRPETFQYFAKCYRCLDRELRAQQFILTQGWSEDTCNKRKRSLKDLDATHDLTNGHPIGKCILNAFRKDAIFYRGDFIGMRKGTPLVNSSQCTTPYRKLFSQSIDESISLWEKAFSEQFRRDRITFKEWDITTPFLLVLLYRSAYQGSIYIDHFLDSDCNDCLSCSLNIQKTMIKLKKNHINTCESLQSMTSSKHDHVRSLLDKISTNCEREQLHLLYHYCNDTARRYPYIEFPHVVKVKIQFRKEKTKIRHIIYMQIPPYFFAVPADSCSSSTYQELIPHFPNVINEIHNELTFERELFFEQRSDLREKENLAMIYPYRFDPDGHHSECRFLSVNIKADGG